MKGFIALVACLCCLVFLFPSEVQAQSAEQWVSKGDAAYEAKEYAEALKCYSAALKRNPRFPKALLGRGKTCYNLGKYDQALVDLYRAKNAKEAQEQAYQYMGLVTVKKGHHDAAQSYFAKAYAISKNPNHYLSAADEAIRSGHCEEAIEYTNVLLRKDPNNERAKQTNERAHHLCRRETELAKWIPAPEMFPNVKEWKRIEQLREATLAKMERTPADPDRCHRTFEFDLQLWHQGSNTGHFELLHMDIPCSDLAKLLYMASYKLQDTYAKVDPVSRCLTRGNLALMAVAFGGIAKHCEYSDYKLAKEIYDTYMSFAGRDHELQTEPKKTFEDFSEMFRVLYPTVLMQ